MSLFILHIHSQECRGCGASQSMSFAYEPEVQGAGTNLKPFRQPLPEGATISVVRLAPKYTFVCEHCVDTSPEAAAKAQAAAERWAETIRRKRGEALLPSETRRFETSKGKTPRAYEPRPIEDLA